jgi:hypothetical protein
MGLVLTMRLNDKIFLDVQGEKIEIQYVNRKGFSACLDVKANRERVKIDRSNRKPKKESPK